MSVHKGDIVHIGGTLADRKELRDQIAIVHRVFVRRSLPWVTVVAWCADRAEESGEMASDWPQECVSLREDAVQVLWPAVERSTQ